MEKNKMNKTKFIEELINQTGYEKEKCEKINDILENTFFVGKKNKELIIEKLINEINITETEADKIYNIIFDIITKSLKEKIKHPFN